MIKEKIKFIFVFIVLSIFIVISATYLGYYMYYEGYIASDIGTCSCIEHAVKEILLSDNSQEKKKELIKEICLCSYGEITIENLSNKTMFYKRESWIINKTLFREFALSAQTIKIKDEYYSIKYKNYIPKFYTTMKYCLYLGKHMTRI